MVHMRNGREVYPSSMALESFKVTMGTEIGVDEYSTSKTYAVGDYCIYTNTIYKCKTAITTPEAFNSSKWDATSIANELMSTKQSLSDLVSTQSGSGSYGVNATLQINNDIMNHPVIILNCGRYGYGNGFVLLRDAITAGFYSNGIGAYINSSRHITIKIDTNGLITIVETNDALNILLVGIC